MTMLTVARQSAFFWCGVVWCGVVWCGVVWCGVVWCGVVWCGVVWCVCVCARACNLVVNLSVLFSGYWAMALLIAQCGTDGLVSRTVPCVSLKY